MNIAKLLQRTTSGGKFIPQIDGLRFVAVFSVVFFHLSNHYFLKLEESPKFIWPILNVFLNTFELNFGRGVELFFAISGFILALPFINHYLGNAEKPKLNNYFVRRLTRLEPPYIISLVIFTFLLFITNQVSFRELVVNSLASLFYISNFIYPNKLPLINGVTWTLEIEVQFYILAPLIFFIFKIKNHFKVYTILISLIVLGIILSSFHLFKCRSLLDYFHYFLIGITISFMYCKNVKQVKLFAHKLFSFTALFLGIVLLFGFPGHNKLIEFTTSVSIFVIFYLAIFSSPSKMLFSIPLFTLFGGMCYSIYLLHLYLIVLLDKLKPTNWIENQNIAYFVHLIIGLLFISFISTIYFLLIEKPCMNKNWPTILKNKILSSKKIS